LELDCAWTNLALITGCDESAHDGCVITRIDKTFNARHRVLKFHGTLVGTIRCHGIKGVGYSHDLGHQGNLITAQTLWIALAIHHLVMHVHTGQEFLHRSYLRHDLVALLRMLLHYYKLVVGKSSRFLKDVVVDGDL